jgi:streptogramin lyase
LGVRFGIFDATNLTRVVYSLPSAVDTFDGAGENAFALDTERGLMATKNYVYELERYEIVVPTLETNADQLFFDASGGLWFLSVAEGELVRQLIER